MQSTTIDDSYVIKLEKGEEIISSIINFCKENNIRSGAINGIGATNDVEISFFDPESKTYIPKQYNGNYEIVSMMGNIALVEGEPFAHIHIALGDSEYKMFGGHLNKGIISVTGEITLMLASGTMERALDTTCDLNLLNLS